MPAASYIDPSSQTVISLCAGEVTLSEVAQACVALRQDKDFRSNFRQLLDLSQVSKVDLHLRDLYELHSAYDPFSNEGRRAVVATQPPTYGLSRMYQHILDTPQFEIFRSLPDALRWLGLEFTAVDGIVHPNAARASFAPPAGSTELSIPPICAAHRRSIKNQCPSDC